MPGKCEERCKGQLYLLWSAPSTSDVTQCRNFNILIDIFQSSKQTITFFPIYHAWYPGTNQWSSLLVAQFLAHDTTIFDCSIRMSAGIFSRVVGYHIVSSARAVGPGMGILCAETSWVSRPVFQSVGIVPRIYIFQNMNAGCEVKDMISYGQGSSNIC